MRLARLFLRTAGLCRRDRPLTSGLSARMMYSLETARLGLRPFKETDLDFLVALNADPDVARYIGYGVRRTRTETEAFLANILKGYREDSLGHLAVLRKATGELIGRCGLTWLEAEAEPPAGQPPRWYWFRGSAPKGMVVANETELGYTFAREHWGNGYATESAKAIRDFAFRELGLSSIVSAIAPQNIASKGVARKLGLEYGGEVTAFDTRFECHRLTRQSWSHGNTDRKV